MALLKKYEAGNKMNVSFDNNNTGQQNLVKKKYDRNANSTSIYDDVSSYADRAYAPGEYGYNKRNEQYFKDQSSKDSSTLMNNIGSIKLKSKSNTGSNTGGETEEGAKKGGNVNYGAMAGAAIKGYSDYQSVQNDPNSTMQQRMDTTSNSVSGVVGAINPIIGAGIGVGNMIAKPIQEDAEQRNEDGTFKNPNKVTNTAVAGALFDGMQAFSARQELAKSGDSSAWYTLDMSKYTKLKEKEGTDAYKKWKNEEDRKKDDKEKFLQRSKDLQSSANLLNYSTGNIYKHGGKLIPKFRRGGSLDLEKENIILDGPSHSDTNNTGIKNDKGLPVVKKGVKVAEIESLELVLNKKSSDKIEKLANTYKRTKDDKVLQEIGTLMESEIKNNTYDYSKKLL